MAEIETRAQQIKKYILEAVTSHPHDLVAVGASKFNVTRTTIHRHLTALIKEDKIFKSGTTNNVSYTLQSPLNKRLTFSLKDKLSESEIWSKNFIFLKEVLPENVLAICEYGFTEMVNNVIDHSQGENVFIDSQQKDGQIMFRIYDDGIGIFKKLKDAFKLSDERESILQLSKGKLTTDPKNHSGEGIFFSSRVFDCFVIIANGLAYIRDNQEDDWFFEKRTNKESSGTLFDMEIAMDSKRILNEVFKKYTDPDTYAFDKTHILVNLSLSNESRFVSRSQAKRILNGLEKFKHIILDFKGVQSAGQAFVDEIFRVFKNEHADVTIDVINANEEIIFMIERGIATAKENFARSIPG